VSRQGQLAPVGQARGQDEALKSLTCLLTVAHGFLSGTPSKNFLAGLSLIDSRVLMERRISASRSGLKSHLRIFRGIPFSGERSVTFVFWMFRRVSDMSLKWANPALLTSVSDKMRSVRCLHSSKGARPASVTWVPTSSSNSRFVQPLKLARPASV